MKRDLPLLAASTATGAADRIAILRHGRNLMAKTWRADGTVKPYDDAKFFQHQVREVRDIGALSALLRELEGDARACVIRGTYVGDELARQRDPEFKPGAVRRMLDYFDDQPLHALLVDVDGFEPLASDPLLDPVGAIDEFVATSLPECFQGVSRHWQLSNSAGHADSAGKLKAHVWYWLATPYTSAQLKAWAQATSVPIDQAVLNPVQVHYTAAPVFEAGVADPVPVRSGFVPGLVDDAVHLVIDEAQIAAAQAQPTKGRGQRLREVQEGDPAARRLAELGLVKSTRRDGGLNIECPFAEEHTGGSGETATTYFPPHTGGHAQGNFKCLHAHCASRTRSEFLLKVGVDEFADDFSPIPTDPERPAPLPGFARDKKGGIEPTMSNTVAALRRADVCGFHIGHDAFRDEVTLADDGTAGHRPMTDADVVRIRMQLERLQFKAAPKETVRDAAVLVAAENAYDSAQLWLDGLTHDGRPRIERFLSLYMGCADTPYTRAVGRYMWSALAGRIIEPGVKADMVPIYEGDQGLRKSSAIEAIVPAPEFFTEIDLSDKEDDTVRKLRGVLVAEIAELSGLHTRALESIKKFVVRRHEKWVPKYREFPTTFARRLLFIGTTNRTDLLADETGNRRWLPVHVTRADAEGIARDRDQLWAEGAALFRQQGVCWQDAERLAPSEHDAYTVEDTWADAVQGWLAEVDDFAGAKLPRYAAPFTTAQALQGALHVPAKEQDRRASNRLSAILRTMGYEQTTKRIAGEPTRAWVKRK